MAQYFKPCADMSKYKNLNTISPSKVRGRKTQIIIRNNNKGLSLLIISIKVIEAKRTNTNDKTREPARNLKSTDRATQKDSITAHSNLIHGFIV
jgi:hypothetical protein